MGRTSGSVLASIGLLLSASVAHAHISLEQGGTHKSRLGEAALKAGPCGTAGSKRGTTNVYTYKPGEKITIKWKEFVQHPGHCRVAFAMDGDAFTDPATATDIKTSLPADVGGGITILADGIMDPPAGMLFTQEITLPMVECANCTLQVIQVMTDKPPYMVGGNDLYYTCIDIVLTAAGAPGTGGMVAGTGGMAAGTGGMAVGTGGVGTSTGGTAAGTGGVGASTGGMAAGAGGMAGMSASGGTAAPPIGAGGMVVEDTKPSNDSGGCSVAHSRSAAFDGAAMLFAMLALAHRRRSR